MITLEPPELGLQRLRAAEEHAAPAAKVVRDRGFEPGPLPGSGQVVQEGGYLPRRVQDRGEGDPSTLIGRQPGRLGGLEPGCERPGRPARRNRLARERARRGGQVALDAGETPDQRREALARRRDVDLEALGQLTERERLPERLLHRCAAGRVDRWLVRADATAADVGRAGIAVLGARLALRLRRAGDAPSRVVARERGRADRGGALVRRHAAAVDRHVLAAARGADVIGAREAVVAAAAARAERLRKRGARGQRGERHRGGGERQLKRRGGGRHGDGGRGGGEGERGRRHLLQGGCGERGQRHRGGGERERQRRGGQRYDDGGRGHGEGERGRRHVHQGGRGQRGQRHRRGGERARERRGGERDDDGGGGEGEGERGRRHVHQGGRGQRRQRHRGGGERQRQRRRRQRDDDG